MSGNADLNSVDGTNIARDAEQEKVSSEGSQLGSDQDSTTRADSMNKEDKANEPMNYGLEFWLIIMSMCALSFTTALDTTIITTALPKIADEIGDDNDYIWIANSFVLSGTVFQPAYGQLSNIFGRRWPYLIAIVLFVLGAGIAGGSHNVTMLIAGRTVQGIGSAGIFVLSDIIVCDLAPLRERAKFMSIVLSTAAIGTVVGPIIGGALATASWRWCFYINLPLGIPLLFLMYFFLRLKHERPSSWQAALARVDYFGIILFIASMVSLLFGLISGGSSYPWSSWRVILPLCLGGAGWIAFHLYEMSPLCKEPSVPPHIFQNRTTSTALILTFLAGLLLNWISYFMPFYFQAVWGATPVLSGVYMLPLLVFMIPSGGLAGGMVSKFGKVKPFHWAAFAMIALGTGLFSILKSTSSPAEWVFFEIFAAIGLGFGMTTLLTAVLASLEEADVAAATSVFSFLRSFGFVWGITIPSIVFNNQFDARSYQISDVSLRQRLSSGSAFGYATSGDVRKLTGATRQEVENVYSESLQIVWYVCLGFALLGFLVVFAEKHVELRTELNTQFGVDDSKRKSAKAKDMEAAQ